MSSLSYQTRTVSGMYHAPEKLQGRSPVHVRGSGPDQGERRETDGPERQPEMHEKGKGAAALGDVG